MAAILSRPQCVKCQLNEDINGYALFVIIPTHAPMQKIRLFIQSAFESDVTVEEKHDT